MRVESEVLVKKKSPKSHQGAESGDASVKGANLIRPPKAHEEVVVEDPRKADVVVVDPSPPSKSVTDALYVTFRNRNHLISCNLSKCTFIHQDWPFLAFNLIV